MKIMWPYLKLLESYLHWFESRGERGPHARFAAACASSVGLVVNLATLMMFIRELIDAHRAWPFDNFLVTIILAAALLALNWWLVGIVSASDAQAASADGEMSARPRSHLWLWYSFISVALLFVGVLFSTR
jgi:hypothetical protein